MAPFSTTRPRRVSLLLDDVRDAGTAPCAPTRTRVTLFIPCGGCECARRSRILDRMPQALPAVIAVSTLGWTLAGIAVVVLFVLWLFCLFDVLVSTGRGAASKALWALALILLAPFAIVAYLIVRTRG